MIQFIKYIFIKYKYKIKNLKINWLNTKIYWNGHIFCWKWTYIWDYSQIQSMSPYKVVLWKNVRISHFVLFYTKTSLADQDFSIATRKKDWWDIIVEDNVWIWAQSFISHWITIGENTVVWANSVVTNSLPPHTICAWSPCKVIKFKSYLKDKEKLKLAEKYTNILSNSLKVKYWWNDWKI